MARKRMSYADHAWLRMDQPDNLMIITGMMTFDAPLELAELRAKTALMVQRFRRFRQRMRASRLPFRRPYWEDDPNFDLDAHVQPITLPEPADKRVLQELISLIMGRPLDYDRPLWMFYLVENYLGGSALIGRMHHSIADGIALMQVLLSMTELNPPVAPADGPADGPEDGPETDGAEPEAASPTRLLPRTSQAAAVDTSEWALHDLVDEGRKLLADREYARLRARQGFKLAAAVGRLALRWPDPPSLFKGPLSTSKRAAWSEPIDLAQVKHIGKSLHATVNDVLLATLAGALGRYLDEVDPQAELQKIRGIIPVNLRPLELDDDLGNKFGLVFLSLPIGVADPLERLLRVKRNMDDLKSSVEPAATFVVLNVMGAVPDPVEELATRFFDTKGTTIITNVPGPQMPLYLTGVRIKTVMAWVPQSSRISLGMSLISYDGQVWLGVATDEGLVPDPETIVANFQLEFDALCASEADLPDQAAEGLATLQPALARLESAMDKLDALLADGSGASSDGAGPQAAPQDNPQDPAASSEA